MHVELTEKELLSCGLPMYVCSLHEKECPCLLCSIAHGTVTWGCAFQVTVSTSNSCCCPVQFFRVVAHWVVMRSWSLVRLNTSLERSVEPPLASMCSLDKENVFPRIDNAEITHFNFKRNNTLTCSAICRSLALGLLPSGHDGRLVQTLISFSSGCQQFRLFLRKIKGGSAIHRVLPTTIVPYMINSRRHYCRSNRIAFRELHSFAQDNSEVHERSLMFNTSSIVIERSGTPFDKWTTRIFFHVFTCEFFTWK